MALNRLRNEAASLSEPALLAKGQSERWNSSRPAVDPSTYPLDLLSAAAVPTEGGKVRLTGFTLDQDHLQISGEATDVTQAYAFIEQLKKNPLLQEYEWTAGQPQLAGKNSVRFEMDGARNPSKP
jgi:chitodextrinase